MRGIRLLHDRQVEFATVLDYVVAIPNGPYDRWIFNHFYRALEEHMPANPGALGEALLSALRREREFCLGDSPRAVWHFANMWSALQKLAEAGQQQLVVQCIATIVDYFAHIRGGVATPMMRQLLAGVVDENLKAESTRLIRVLPDAHSN